MQFFSWGRGCSVVVVTVWVQAVGWHQVPNRMQEGADLGLTYVSLSLHPGCRLDYSGIALLIMGSFVPWLYYSFYCSPQPRLIYLSIVCVLGISAIIVAQWDRFATPKHRQTRAGRSAPCSSESPATGRSRAGGAPGAVLWDPC